MAENTSQAKAAPAAVKKKKAKRSVPTGQVHILATFNNTIVTFTDSKGAVLTTGSAGACGFRGSKKGTAYAAQVATEKAGNVNIQVENITDVTGVPHGGVRPRKARRI
jgi:small subunit ribosomal protein S11